MDTLGSLVDKLMTVDLKMWNNQELLYAIRRMSFDEFEIEFLSTKDRQSNLFECLKKACDLNVQRNQFIDEIDQKIIDLVEARINKEELNGKFLQQKHKTY